MSYSLNKPHLPLKHRSSGQCGNPQDIFDTPLVTCQCNHPGHSLSSLSACNISFLHNLLLSPFTGCSFPTGPWKDSDQEELISAGIICPEGRQLYTLDTHWERRWPEVHFMYHTGAKQAPLFPKDNMGTNYTNAYVPYSEFNVIHTHINGFLYTCKWGQRCSWGGEAPASSFWLPRAHPQFRTSTVDPALLRSAKYITELIDSCSSSGFPDYWILWVVQWSGRDSSTLELQDFSYEMIVCLAKHSLYQSYP